MKKNEYIQNSIEFIETNLYKIKNSYEVANHFGITENVLNEVFKALTGFTATEYIRNRKLYEAAIKLVHTNAKIIDVSIDCGFESPEGFIRAFKKFHGARPSIIRKKK